MKAALIQNFSLMERGGEAILTYLLAGIRAAFLTICTKDDVSRTDTGRSVLYFALGGLKRVGDGAVVESRVTGHIPRHGFTDFFSLARGFFAVRTILIVTADIF
jgi:hypothetical protein